MSIRDILLVSDVMWMAMSLDWKSQQQKIVEIVQHIQMIV